MKLAIQSMNNDPVQVQDVVVNENADCSANPLATLGAVLQAEGRDPGVLARIPSKRSLAITMKYGDKATVPLFDCDPIRVRIVTDHGEAVYNLK